MLCAEAEAAAHASVTAAMSNVLRFIPWSLGSRRHESDRPQQLDFLLEHTVQLVGEQPACRVPCQRLATPFERRVYHFQVLLDNRNRRGIEILSACSDYRLKSRDLRSVSHLRRADGASFPS